MLRVQSAACPEVRGGALRIYLAPATCTRIASAVAGDHLGKTNRDEPQKEEALPSDGGNCEKIQDS